jgi:hypothetical protein
MVNDFTLHDVQLHYKPSTYQNCYVTISGTVCFDTYCILKLEITVRLVDGS